MARRKPLSVWLYGTRVAELMSAKPAEVTLSYTEEALETWPANTPLLSCSLPLRPRRQQAGPFFRGLLPEGRHLQAMAAEANVASYDTFGLLERFGRDVAGAAMIAHDDPGARPGRVLPYSADGLAEDVSSLPEHPLALRDDSELSLAGLQDKLLLVDLGEGRWGRPVHGWPSTHILKVEDRRFPGMAAMEVACLRLARAAGLTTITADVAAIADLPCLIVSRFDRTSTEPGHRAERIHQEDACQALGRDIDSQQGRGKHERAGGPSLAEIARLLDRYAVDAGSELERLAGVATFTALIGNADAHGKNLALVHPAPDEVRLAPLYDTVPTMLWPKLPATAAMSINHRTVLAEVTLDDIVAEAAAWPSAAHRAREAGHQVIEAVIGALGEDIPPALAEAVVRRADDLRGT